MHNETLPTPEPIFDQADLAALEPALYEYERADGTIERANSAEEVLEVCPVLGKLAMESPDVAQTLLDLAAVGREKMAQAAAEPEPKTEQTEPEAKIETELKPKVELPKKTEVVMPQSDHKQEPKIESQAETMPVPESTKLVEVSVSDVTSQRVVDMDVQVHEVMQPAAGTTVEAAKTEPIILDQPALIKPRVPDLAIVRERELFEQPAPELTADSPIPTPQKVQSQPVVVPRPVAQNAPMITYHEMPTPLHFDKQDIRQVEEIRPTEAVFSEYTPQESVIAEQPEFVTSFDDSSADTIPRLHDELQLADPEAEYAFSQPPVSDETTEHPAAFFDEFVPEHEHRVKELPHAEETYSAVDEVVTPQEILFAEANEQPLDQTLTLLEHYLAQEPVAMPEQLAEKQYELATALQDIADLLPKAELPNNADPVILEEKRDLTLTPELVQKLVVLLEVLGYEEPQEVLATFVEEQGEVALLQIVQKLSQPTYLFDSKEFLNVSATPTRDDDPAEPHSVLGGLVLKLFSTRAFAAAN